MKAGAQRRTPQADAWPQQLPLNTLDRYLQSLLLLPESQANGGLGCCIWLTHSSLLAYPSHTALVAQVPGQPPGTAQLGNIKNLAPLRPVSAPLGPSHCLWALPTAVLIVRCRWCSGSEWGYSL